MTDPDPARAAESQQAQAALARLSEEFFEVVHTADPFGAPLAYYRAPARHEVRHPGLPRGRARQRRRPARGARPARGRLGRRGGWLIPGLRKLGVSSRADLAAMAARHDG